ncbi:MAG TPA: hypothetical protein ENK62_06990 [Chromatiales bacterium]|nr:hypothetical protein [Chromatiales bacterium]
MQNRLPVRLLAMVTGLLATSCAWAYPIAGVEPWHRPKGAPVIKEVHKDAAWYRQALHGIQPPYPASFRFLEDQGNWHTPFNRPGMLPPYDLRGWHTGR